MRTNNRTYPYGKLVMAGIAGITLLGAACTLAPVDGATVASRTDAVALSGYHLTADKTIEVQSFNPLLNDFVTVATTKTSTSPFHYGDVDLFPWSVSVSGSVLHWQAGAAGFVARLRSRDSDGTMHYTFPPNWIVCLNEHPAVADFVSNCASPHSPAQFLYTTDFPTSTDLVITNIRRSGSGLIATIKNQGRHGKLGRVECFHTTGSNSTFPDHPLFPAESVDIGVGVAVAVGQTVTCLVSGVNEDGTSESLTLNNSLSRTLM